MNNFLKRFFNQKVDGIGLAIFRIFYSLVLLGEIGQFYYFRHLMFDNIPYLEEAEISFAIPITIWAISVILILFGAFTRLATILNYVMSLILIGSISSYEYHVFYAYMGINFILMFTPISQALSIDRLLTKLKYSNTTYQHYPIKKVRQIHYLILPFLGLALVYFDSIFYKLVSPAWLNGLGSWYPSSLPQFTHVNATPFLNQEYLVKAIGYGTIIFESIFIFTFFRKKWRIPLLIIGLILHLGILYQFPIPFFALTCCSIYLLMVPLGCWNKLFGKLKGSKPTLFIYYDIECPLCVRTKITVNHLDWLKKIEFKTVQYDAAQHEQLKEIENTRLLKDIHCVNRKGQVFYGIDTYLQIFKRIFYLYPLYLMLSVPGVYHLAKFVYNYVASKRLVERCTEENCGYNPPNIIDYNEVKILQSLTLKNLKYSIFKIFVVICILLQLGFIYNSWGMQKVRSSIGLCNTAVDAVIPFIVSKYGNLSKWTVGMTSHPVFSDKIHFNDYNHIIGITYVNDEGLEKWLPLIDENGQPVCYNYGANWVKYTFRVNSPYLNQGTLNKGLRDFTAFWAFKNNISLDDAKFNIKVKIIDTPDGWEKDFLNKQIAKPWVSGGNVIWKDKQFYSNVKDIESLK